MQTVARLLVLLTLALAANGCASHYAWSDPAKDLRQRKFFYVEAEFSDGKNLHQTIANELHALGYTVSSGYLTMIPSEADTLVSFQSRWTWDFTTYLIELNLQVRDVATGKIIASSGYHRPAISGTSTQELIQKTLAPIFPPKLAPAPTTP